MEGIWGRGGEEMGGLRRRGEKLGPREYSRFAFSRSGKKGS